MGIENVYGELLSGLQSENQKLLLTKLKEDGTLEKHMLEKVRETRLARFLAVAAHMVLDRHRHHRVGFILVQNHLETVVEFVFFIFQGCGIPVFTAAHACHNSSHQ